MNNLNKLSNIFYYLGIIYVVCTTNVIAKDFGKLGHSLEIKEEGILKLIDKRLKQLDLERENIKMQEIVRNSVLNPVAVDGITTASKNREFFYDPSYLLDEDITNEEGEVIHKAGLIINPLDKISLDQELYFIDGQIEEQILWLEKILADMERTRDQDKGGKALEQKVILVAGSPLRLEEKLGRKVYFDQKGYMTKKFGIKASPAIAVQEGSRLKITEVNLNKRE